MLGICKSKRFIKEIHQDSHIIFVSKKSVCTRFACVQDNTPCGRGLFHEHDLNLTFNQVLPSLFVLLPTLNLSSMV